MGDVMGFISDWSGKMCYTKALAFSVIYLTDEICSYERYHIC